MAPAPSPTPRDARLFAYVALGTLAGAAYVAFDALSESRLATGTLTGPLASAHVVIDRIAPIAVGAVLGVLAHYVFLRRKLQRAEEAAARAEALRTRLLKVERDQAVWVLAAAVLHELNNPLHALGLLLDEHGAEKDDARRGELIDRARAQIGRARSHLAALRGLRRFDEPFCGKIALERLIRGLADDVRPLAAEGGVSVRAECDASVEVSADEIYVRTILENLVDNGLSAMRAGGGRQITIELFAQNGLAVVRVADDAPPLDDEARRHLFEPLHSTKTNGLGLGLPIARALARAMGGDLSLDPTGGKAFRLELPLNT
jgi:signal transduction histidine kinase